VPPDVQDSLLSLSHKEHLRQQFVEILDACKARYHCFDFRNCFRKMCHEYHSGNVFETKPSPLLQSQSQSQPLKPLKLGPTMSAELRYAHVRFHDTAAALPSSESVDKCTPRRRTRGCRAGKIVQDCKHHPRPASLSVMVPTAASTGPTTIPRHRTVGDRIFDTMLDNCARDLSSSPNGFVSQELDNPASSESYSGSVSQFKKQSRSQKQRLRWKEKLLTCLKDKRVKKNAVVENKDFQDTDDITAAMLENTRFPDSGGLHYVSRKFPISEVSL
jgi:hypothetical protein